MEYKSVAIDGISMKKQQESAAGCELTSTRWLSGPYRSLSSSITRLLKNEENFFFCLPGCEAAKRQHKMKKENEFGR